jgi:Uma2 family endonuclease
VREPAPTHGHQILVSRLLERLLPLVGSGNVTPGPTDVLVDEHNVLQPDVVVLDRPSPADSSYVVTPLLVFEVLSPATARRDRRRKVPAYLRLGVREVWVVDPTTATIEIHVRRDGRDVVRSASGRQRLASGVLPDLALEPEDLFRLPAALPPLEADEPDVRWP